MGNKREYTESYLFEQIQAMRWLKEQGVSCEQIRDMRWGMVDETDRCIHLPASICSLKLDLATGEITKETVEKGIILEIKGSGHEWFFLKSKYKCPWMFTERVPKSWRREKSREECYSLEAVENMTKGIPTPDISPFIESLNELTKALEFDTISISMANITNPETKELVEIEAGKNHGAKLGRMIET